MASWAKTSSLMRLATTATSNATNDELFWNDTTLRTILEHVQIYESTRWFGIMLINFVYYSMIMIPASIHGHTWTYISILYAISFRAMINVIGLDMRHSTYYRSYPGGHMFPTSRKHTQYSVRKECWFLALPISNKDSGTQIEVSY
ncbi:hypothetical protein GGS26DRAFT_579285 [Hypomontagnella submonticulosa]|nr:hypothetical protein GGS26DRAFT_579285 [Hypomontagnella submonticulosa]